MKDKTGENVVTNIATCFTCGAKGHRTGSALCKGKIGKSVHDSYIHFVNEAARSKKIDNVFVIPTFVNGVQCKGLRDRPTGSSCSLINLDVLCNHVKPCEGRYI